ncbi:MAG: response regulator transcription factor [Flavobacteriales bacterium]|nr:response regulator transcription factor [Flavobacteriales bacterium]MBL6873023.1 response regulator transcription factor [Flavobacteriales bacterium]
MKPKVLVVDDEDDILEFISYNLVKEGFEVKLANNGIEAIEIAKKFLPDLIILDVMMPDMDGITTCHRIKSIKDLSETIITFLSARSEDYTQIAGLDSGADDYITKPIRPRLLISRVNALLRRKSEFNNQNQIVNIGDLSLDSEKFILKYKNNLVDITKKEFALYELLLSKPGKVFKRQEILEKVWGNDIIIGDRTIDVHIRKIRSKTNPNYIKTIKGVGYKFEC